MVLAIIVNVAWNLKCGMMTGAPCHLILVLIKMIWSVTVPALHSIVSELWPVQHDGHYPVQYWHTMGDTSADIVCVKFHPGQECIISQMTCPASHNIWPPTHTCKILHSIKLQKSIIKVLQANSQSYILLLFGVLSWVPTCKDLSNI